MNYDTIPSADVINKTADTLGGQGLQVFTVENRAEALAKVKELIPAGASVNNGSSTTLLEIGFVDYLKGDAHGWNNLHAAVLAEKDPVKQAQLRKESVFADYYVGSVHALAETGEMLIASASGSQLSSIVFTSPNLIFVVGAQKITPTHGDAMRRLKEYVVPLEDKRMKDVGMGGTVLAKIVTFLNEPAFMERKVRVILVKEKLGF
ncbi:MAG: LUD domain-containing protein [Patescibacteria group bacterium]